MEIAEAHVGKIVILRVKGRLDTTTSGAFEEKLMAFIDAGHQCVALDFAQLDYISSTGLRVLLSATKKLGNTGKMVLYAMKDQIKKVFDIAGFSAIFTSFDSEEEALRSLAQ